MYLFKLVIQLIHKYIGGWANQLSGNKKLLCKILYIYHIPKNPDPSKTCYFEDSEPCYTGSNPSIGGSQDSWGPVKFASAWLDHLKVGIPFKETMPLWFFNHSFIEFIFQPAIFILVSGSVISPCTLTARTWSWWALDDEKSSSKGNTFSGSMLIFRGCIFFRDELEIARIKYFDGRTPARKPPAMYKNLAKNGINYLSTGLPDFFHQQYYGNLRVPFLPATPTP